MITAASSWQMGVLLFVAAQTAISNLLPRVYNGEDDAEHKYPYVITFITDVSSDPYRGCSGTLIAANWVLTAAHCEIDVKMNTTLVQYGNMSVAPAEATTTSKIHKVFTHPGFVDFNVINDLALVEIERVPMNRFGNISAVDYKSLIGLAIEYAGYGATYLETDKKLFELVDLDQTKPLQVGLGVIRTCDGGKHDREPFICVTPRCDKADQDSKPGDSGSPLFYDGKIIGVLMGGNVFPPVTSQYTAVSPYIDWIHGIMNGYMQR